MIPLRHMLHVKSSSLMGIIAVFFTSLCFAGMQDLKPLKVPSQDIEKRFYICNYTSDKITVDGIVSEKAWDNASWSKEFVDIEGDSKTAPYYTTRMKMLWGEKYLYICAELQEEHIWAKLKEKDSVIYYDNDFEIFIDPNMDTHNYLEVEVNAFNTIWDLILLKPYRDRGPVTNSYDLNGLESGIGINGTLNNPDDIDTSWTVEVAIPWKTIYEIAGTNSPPLHGDSWYINYSRVQWQTEIVDGNYTKRKDENGNTLGEYNWVWSPQGLINMHYPEQWGIVIFNYDNSNLEAIRKGVIEEEEIRKILRHYYYAERNYYFDHDGIYTADLENLIPYLDKSYVEVFHSISIYITPSDFEIIYEDSSQKKSWHIRSDGELWNSSK